MTRSDVTIVDNLKEALVGQTKAEILFQLDEDAQTIPTYEEFKKHLHALSRAAHKNLTATTAVTTE